MTSPGIFLINNNQKGYYRKYSLKLDILSRLRSSIFNSAFGKTSKFILLSLIGIVQVNLTLLI